MPTRKIRTLAHLTLFAGWMLPIGLARLATVRLPEAGVGVARLLEMVAGAWAFVALMYGLVLAMRLRRGIAD